MLLSFLLIVPAIGTVLMTIIYSYSAWPGGDWEYRENDIPRGPKSKSVLKIIALLTSTVNFIISTIIFILFNNSTNQFQYVQEHYNIQLFDIYLGLDGITIYFILLTTIIIPVALLSNWDSIQENRRSYLVIMLLLETLLLAVFMTLDIMLFYIFFESILPPLFILVGLFGSDNKISASYYLFLYTLWGSLFLLLAILSTSSTMGSTDFDTLFKLDLEYKTQIFLFIGIFIAFAVKTPVYALNNWLLKAHVESPLGGSIVLAAIVLKLSLYGIFRLILPLLSKVTLDYTFIIYVIGTITVLYASFSTIRTTDIKELIAYSSVAHASVYLMSAFSNTIQGIEGSIILGLAHGFVSSGLFVGAGGVLYDRTGTRSINFYRGLAQLMPILSLLFFILCLGNCGTPLTFNFMGEFMSLSGITERLPLMGFLACSSIVLSAAYSIYMFNRVYFGGSFTRFLEQSISDVNKREFLMLFGLVVFTVILGIYPGIILDVLHYSGPNMLYSLESLNCCTHNDYIHLSVRNYRKNPRKQITDNKARQAKPSAATKSPQKKFFFKTIDWQRIFTKIFASLFVLLITLPIIIIIKYQVNIHLDINLVDLNNPTTWGIFTGIIIVFRSVFKVIIEEIIEQKGGLGSWFGNPDILEGGGRNNPKSTRQSRMTGLSTMNTQSSNPQQGSSSSNPAPTQSSNQSGGSRSSRPQSSNLSQGSRSTLPRSSNQPQNPRPLQLPRQASSTVPTQEEALDINFLFPNHQELRSSIMNKLNSRYAIPSRRLRGLNIGHSSEYVEGFGHFTDEEKRFLVALSVKATPVIHTEGLLRGLRLAIITTDAKMGCGIHNIRVDRVDRLRVSDLVRVKKYQDGTLSWVSISNSKEDIEQFRKFLRDARI